MSKIKINFEEANFLIAKNNYNENQLLLTQAIENYNKIIGTELPKGAVQEFQKDIFSNTIEDIKKRYPDAYKLGLTIEKLCDLFNIDLAKIKDLTNRYTPNLIEPKESDFYQFAETPEQLKRLDNCQKLIDAWTELSKDTDREILLPINPFVMYKNNQKNEPLIANHNYILNGN